MAKTNSPSFLVLVSGQIESAEFPLFDSIYCKWSLVFGPDWQLTSGLEAGVSQVSKPSSVEGEEGQFVLNFPLEFTFKAASPSGWPQLVLSCYGNDLFNNDVVRGYGAVHLPITPGNHRRRVAMFVPEPSSLLQKFAGLIVGRRPEFVDQRIVAQPEGRDVTRVKTQGFVTSSFNVVLKDVKRLGYDVCPKGVLTLSEFPFQPPPALSESPAKDVHPPEETTRPAHGSPSKDDSAAAAPLAVAERSRGAVDDSNDDVFDAAGPSTSGAQQQFETEVAPLETLPEESHEDESSQPR